MGSAEPSSFGELLRRLRTTARLTQEDLAERAGLSARGIQDLERGLRRSPHPDTTRRLAEALRLGDAERAEFLTALDRAGLAGRSARAAHPSAAPPLPSSPAVAARPLPTGTLTFLFTDVEGSTRMWEQHHDAMQTALARHDELIQALVEHNDGALVRPRGEGDSRFAVFARASDAVAAALAIQRALNAEPWPDELPLRVRTAVHTGEASLRAHDYYGSAVNRCARLRGVAHGGQLLLSQSTCDLTRASLPPEAALLDLGWHRLADLAEPEHVYQLTHPELPAKFPPVRSLNARLHNLPIQLTSFVGRETELAEVQRLLGSTRLLTLTGAGGSGKTRLALHTAAGLLDDYLDGVWAVELASLAEPALLPQTVASALGLVETPNRSPLELMRVFLRERRVLLVLDNCEHLVVACAELAEAVLRSCAYVRILATSRERLGVVGEQLWSVPPLSLPHDEADAPASEAVRLFVDRARLVQADFELDTPNTPLVFEVCRRLGGIPLAIELAAARIRALGLEEIASRLDEQLRLLTSASRTAPPRQQTLRATIDWSYALLDQSERRLFDRLSIFAGGWDIQAAEAVVAGDGVDRPDVVDVLARLADRSMILVASDASSTTVRYGMLETLREYGREQLEARGEAEVVRTRHANFFARLAEQGERELQGRAQRQWLHRLTSEQDNLREAMAWAIEHGELVDGLRLAAASWRFWTIRAYLSEGSRWLDALLAASEGADVPAALRARALNGSGQLAFAQGNWDASAARFEASLAQCRKRGDQSGIAAALRDLGRVAQARGEYTRATTLYEQSLAIRRGLGEKGGVADCLDDLGEVARHRGEYLQAAALDEEALALHRELEDSWGTAYSLNELANVARHQGDYARGIALCTEALALQRELGDPRGAGWSLYNLGLMAQAQGDYERAPGFYEESLSLFREAGDKRGISSGIVGLADIARMRGDLPRARDLLEQALQLSRERGEDRAVALTLEGLAGLAETLADPREATVLHRSSLAVFMRIGDQRGIAIALEGLARAAALEGHSKRAVTWFGAASTLRRKIGAEPGRAEDAIASVRDRLGQKLFDKMWAAGCSLQLESVLAEAISPLATPLVAEARRQANGPPPSLTRREREVVRLVALGRTNREVGEALVISPGTVRTHVEHILAKLGLRSRVEIAVWVIEHGVT